MYLYRKTYVKNWEWQKPEQQHQITVKLGGVLHPDIKPERVCYIVEEICYWRKANQIHAWFVKNVQNGVDDCANYYVGRSKLQELLDLVTEVLHDRSKAPLLLPSRSGFFFGSTDYDEYYFEKLEHIQRALAAALTEPGDEFEYHSSW